MRDVGGLALHGLESIEETGDADLDGLAQFLLGDGLLGELLDLLANRRDGRLALVRIDAGMDDEDAGIAGCVAAGFDSMYQAALLAKLAIQAGTVALAENDRQHVERIHVGIRDRGNMPREIDLRDLHRHLFMPLAQAELGRLGRDERRADRSHLEILRLVAKFLLDLGGIHVAHHHEDDVVRDVVLLVIRHHVVAGDAVVNVRIADDGEAVGV